MGRRMKSNKLFRTSLVWVALLQVSAALVSAGERRSANDSHFSESVFLDRVSILASDEFEGRGTGQEGIDKAADYIATEFAEMGVLPGGDDGAYFQNFTLNLSKRIAAGTRLRIGLKGESPIQTAKLHDQYTAFPFSASEAFEGEVVFAGYGIICEEENYNDYAGLDVAGKVVLVLRRAPRFAEFSRTDMAFRTKASRANGRDAAALLIVNPTFDEDGDTLFDFGDSGLGGAGGFGSQSYGLPMLHIRRDLAEQLLRAGGLPDLATLEKQIDETERPRSAPLEGVSVRGQVKIEPVASPARNVIGVIPGTGPNADEFIVLGAHYDHLGIVRKGEEDFDAEKHIWNGADDNASGTSLVMTVAEAFARGRAPNRSLLLILFTGEERGLLGSRHYVDHPTVDLKRVVAMLNFDMVGRLKKDTLEVGGMRTGGFEPLVRRLAETHGLKVKDGGGGRGPSDHTSFYNKNIPVMFFFTGLHRQYHQPDDDVPLLNIPGAIQIAKLVADVVDEIDTSEQTPKFAKDNRSPRINRRQIDDDDEEHVEETRVAAAAGRARTPSTGSGRGQGTQPAAAGERVRLGIHPDPTETKDGVRIAEIIADSPADRAGMKEGDRIVRLRQKEVAGIEDLLVILEGLKWGDESTAVVKRDGKDIELPIQFGEKPAARPTVAHMQDGAATRGSMVELMTAYADWIQRRESLMGRAIEVTREEQAEAIVLRINGLDPDLCSRMNDETLDLIRRYPGGVSQVETSIAVSTDTSGELTSVVTIRVPTRTKPQQKTAAREHAHPTAIARADKPVMHDAPHGKPASPKSAAAKDPHGDLPDDMDMPSMPPVRLGIMPSYGETEGEGYEITGVVPEGPAARAGMLDEDRIYKIGDALVTDVYTYMDALRKYKQGDDVKVIIIRDGKKITLTMKAGGPQAKEAS